MKILQYLGPLLLVLPLCASSLQVTTETSVLLHTGDELFFTVSTYGFGVNAANNGIGGPPASVSFNFVSSMLAGGAVFDAALESRDGAASAAFPQLTFGTGQFQGAYYSGTVAVLGGSLALDPALSQQIFGGSSAVLVLTNAGPDVQLGLPPYTLAQNLTVSLGAEGLSCGAPTVAVRMEDVGAAAPEPGSLALFVLGGILALAAKRVNRGLRHGIQ